MLKMRLTWPVKIFILPVINCNVTILRCFGRGLKNGRIGLLNNRKRKSCMIEFVQIKIKI